MKWFLKYFHVSRNKANVWGRWWCSHLYRSSRAAAANVSASLIQSRENQPFFKIWTLPYKKIFNLFRPCGEISVYSSLNWSVDIFDLSEKNLKKERETDPALVGLRFQKGNGKSKDWAEWVVLRPSPLFRSAHLTWWCSWPAPTTAWRSGCRNEPSSRDDPTTTPRPSTAAWPTSSKTPSLWSNTSRRGALLWR